LEQQVELKCNPTKIEENVLFKLYFSLLKAMPTYNLAHFSALVSSLLSHSEQGKANLNAMS
jgi:hypothetical protein